MYKKFLFIVIFIIYFINLAYAELPNEIASNTNNSEILIKKTIFKESDNWLENKEVKIENFLELKFGKEFDSKDIKYRHCQGMTSDQKYLYLAIITKTKIQKDTFVKILKIDTITKNIVLAKDMGQLGHCNSLTYSPITDKIYTSPTFDKNAYLFEFDRNLENIKKIDLKNQDGTPIKKQCNKSILYSEYDKEFIIKFSHNSIGYFGEDFVMRRRLKTDQLRVNDNVYSQALSSDGNSLISICNDLKHSPTINYILIYDMKGKKIKEYKLDYGFGEIDEKPELEQITYCNGKYYGLTKAKTRFIISIISLKNK